MAAISYDSVEILKTFAQRAGITYPLLSDPDIQVIEAFGIVNTGVPEDSPHYGYPYAGYYLIGPDGVVREKYFNERNNDRTTAASILVRTFGQSGSDLLGKADSKHLAMTWSASNGILRPGQRATLVLDIDLKAKMHVYAPGEHRYIAVDWEMEPPQGLEIAPPDFPPGEQVYLEVIDETVPVYSGSLRVIRDIHLLGSRTLPEVLEGQEEITISGEFRYQACDDRICYMPQAIPVRWTLGLEPHDLVRIPEKMRRDAAGR